MRRVLLAALVALGLAPGVFWRTPLPPPDRSPLLEAEPLPVPGGKPVRIGGSDGPLLTGLWRLSSSNDRFGSYSALVAPAPGVLLAFSDRGDFLRMKIPPARRGKAAFGRVLPGARNFKKMNDIESAAHDPASGRIWLGFEDRNAVMRDDGEFAELAAMRHWPGNSGPEAMTRLPDGRFVILSEAALAQGGRASEGLLFPGDPLDGAEPLTFAFAPPPGYEPSDMAALPDGRVLILLRGVALGIPPHFTARLALADPREIEAGKAWDWETVAELGGAVPLDNYEGLAITGGQGGGPVTIWLISDDNESLLIQRSLLLRFEWQAPDAKRRASR